MAISDKLNYLIETKQLFKDRLNSLGAEVIESTTFRNYLNWLDTFYKEVSDKTDLAKNGVVGRTSQDGEPTPENPVEINNLSGDVEYKVRGQGISEIFPLSLKSKNLWNITDYRNIDITDNARSTHSTTEDKIIINTGDTTYEGVYLKQVYQNIDNYNEQNVYYVSFDAVANQDLNFLYGESGGVQSKTTIGTQKVRLSQKCNPKKNLILYSISMRANDTIEISNIMISTSNDTTYEPYYDIELCKIGTYQDSIKKSTGKNLFNKKITPENYFYNASGERTYDSNYLYINQTIENINYNSITISFFSKIGYTNVRICEYNSSGTFIKRALVDTNNQVVNLDNATAKIIISVNSDSNAYFNCLMINEGNTALPYEPYGKVWYLNKQIGKVVFDGSENWTKSSNTNVNRYYIPGTFINTILDFNTIDLISDYFTCITQTQSDANNIGLAKLNSASVMINFSLSDTDFDTLEKYKTWLSTHNTIVYYVLATPTITEITQENYPTLYSQLLAIQEFLTKYKINKEFLLDYSSPEIEY